MDIILNHMTGDSPGETIGTGGSTANTSELYYHVVPYRRQNFHKICSVNNYQDPANVRNCELVGLHDLDQSQEWVRDMMVRMMNDAVVAGVAGFRYVWLFMFLNRDAGILRSDRQSDEFLRSIIFLFFNMTHWFGIVGWEQDVLSQLGA